ncbi:hypothetical protein GCM10027051_21660 [Niabella terrae]
MNRSVLKPIIAGVIIGAAFFFMPFFILRVAIVVLIVIGLLRLFGGHRYRRGFGGPQRFAGFADKIRNMSEEEYQQFKQKFQGHCGRPQWNDVSGTA